MSQKKVDYYKEQKANRKEIIKKEKRVQLLERIIGTLIAIAVVCWVGFSIYSKVTTVPETEAGEVQETVINTNALSDYMDSLMTEEAE
ncbi:MAG: hypothetical protein IJX90_11800 [Blautia sp.]|nr:hypothetical protein [Blautia sp.]